MYYYHSTPLPLSCDMTAVSAEDETQAQVTLSIDLGKPSLKKKSVTFFTLESDPPPIFRKV